MSFFFFFQAEDGIRDLTVTGVQTCALPLAAALAGADIQSALAHLAARTAELAASLARIAAVDELEGARTLEVTARGFTLSLMPFDISERFRGLVQGRRGAWIFTSATLSLGERSEEHTSELQSQSNLVCRLLLEKKKNQENAAQKPLTTLN